MNDMKNGKGFESRRGWSYRGRYRNDMKNGFGEEIWSDRRKYSG